MTARGTWFVTPPGGGPYRVTVAAEGDGWVVEVERDGHRRSFALTADAARGLAREGTRALHWRRDAAGGTLRLDGRTHVLAVESEAAHRVAASAARPDAAHGVREVRAPMPGLVVAILADEGSEAAAGQGVVVMEAMKMENEIAAPAAGVVRGLAVRPGQAVEKGTLLFRVEPAAVAPAAAQETAP